MKKLLSIALITLLSVGQVQAASFPDVKTSDWFYQDVMNMVEWGVIRGNDDGTFKPSNNVNRAELSAMWNRYDTKVKVDQKLEDEKITFSVIKLTEQNAIVFSNLASIYGISTGGNGACEMYKYYYDNMKQNYITAKFLAGTISSIWDIDTQVYDQRLSDYKVVYNECTF